MSLQSAPFHAIIKDEPVADAYWAKAADGTRIRVAHWKKTRSKGTVLLFPGRSEYIEKYAITAQDFAAKGFGTFAIDWRGQGLADRLTEDANVGYVLDFADYQSDLEAALDVAKALKLPKPWYLLGHSMGGAIGLRALYNGLDVAAASFSAPMWGVGSTATIRYFGRMLGAAASKLGLGHHYAPGASSSLYVIQDSFPDNGLTTDSAMYVRLQDQARANPELCIAGFSYQWAYKAIDETKALEKIAAPSLPCLTFWGTDEDIVNPSAIENRMARWRDCKTLLVPTAKHEILMEGPKRQPVIEALAAFYQENR